jgi:hypothetical protein
VRAEGRLQLCAACRAVGRLETCAPGQHEYRGYQDGQWLCVKCDTSVASQPVSTERVEAKQTMTDDGYC